jgi:hypothetical protein
MGFHPANVRSAHGETITGMTHREAEKRAVRGQPLLSLM